MTVFHAIVELSKASWRVLRRHPCLAWFPVLSLASVIAVRALRGEAPSIPNGLATATTRVPAIASLSAITASVGFAIGLLGRSTRVGVKLARAVVETTWSLATYLAIPVMVQERRGGLMSLRRSSDLFRRTWGETTLSEVGVRVLTAHLSLILLVVAVALLELLGDSIGLLVVLALVVGFIAVVGALEAIYRAALYVFAAEGVVPEPFSGPELDAIWHPK